LVDWCLTPTLAIFQLYHGVKRLFIVYFIYIYFSKTRYMPYSKYLLLQFVYCYSNDCLYWWRTTKNNTKTCGMFVTQELVRNDKDVNEHKRLSNITLKHKSK